jgi:hypothetical protein
MPSEQSAALRATRTGPWSVVWQQTHRSTPCVTCFEGISPLAAEPTTSRPGVQARHLGDISHLVDVVRTPSRHDRSDTKLKECSVTHLTQAAAGPLSVSATNPRYFTLTSGDRAGQAVHLTGSHIWNNLHDRMGPARRPQPSQSGSTTTATFVSSPSGATTSSVSGVGRMSAR